MDRVLISRQPIYRRDMSTLGYELLFRDSDTNTATIRDEDEATAQVIVNTFMEIGLQEMVGPSLAFINLSSTFLQSEFCESLPADRVVLELLEPPGLDASLKKRVDDLVEKGYKIAVSDFAFGDGFQPLLDVAHYVKFDVLGSHFGRIRDNIARIDPTRTRCVAERVETIQQFEFCQGLGLDYFQGYFFSRPEFVRSTRLPLSRLMTLRLIAKLNDSNLTLDELEAAIRQDISLSYKLLRYVGSAALALRREIQSIRHAAVLTGIDRLKIWAALILFSGIEEKIRDITVTAVVRARMCEKLAESLKVAETADRFFLVGLFSLLDVMLNRPLEEVLESLQLAPEISAALLRQEGDLGHVLQCVIAYERRDWPNVRCGDLDQDTIRGAYVKSMAWSMRTLNGFSDAITNDAVVQENAIHLRRGRL